ncbi:hypothetical protein M4I21_16785 [Cellulophaga sp. 20_2_10]|uniref:hypothetical protein n=1 Tax=Cellulophaga sp. 20_2_10 TaxID=2942476 RepID=UPI00201B2334|nr:hypothetical protein [Cellulophaga sp. 20_2_10]MCL5247479.1 hypothetical protein [Cellulophaga sp. 20_2_10]
MRMNKILTILVLAILCTACTKKIGKDKLDLENFSLSFNVDDFYADEIAKEKTYESQIVQIYNDEKKEEDFGDDLVTMWDFFSITTDTIHIGHFYDDKKNDIVGIDYTMGSWRVNDSLAYYNKMYFEKINIMKTSDDDFIALAATNESYGVENFENLLRYITSKHGEPKITEDISGYYYLYSWLIDNNLVAITSTRDNKNNTLNLDLIINKGNANLDTVKKPIVNTRLFVVNKKYKESITGQQWSGDWIYLKLK